MLFSAASASGSLPLRAASITRFTAAMSSGEVAVAGAGSKRPDSGCATGLNTEGLAVTGPRRATLLGTGADAAAAGNGRLRGSGTSRTTCTAGRLAAWTAGLGGAAGTFLGAAMADWAPSAPTATSARAMLRRFHLIASIQPLARSAVRCWAATRNGRPAPPIRPLSRPKDTQNPYAARHKPQAGRKRGRTLFIKPIHGPI